MQYNENGQLTDIAGSDGTHVDLGYTAKGNPGGMSMTKDGQQLSGVLYSYLDSNNLLDQVQLVSMDNGTVKYYYDEFNRVSDTTHTPKSSNTNISITAHYEYEKGFTSQQETGRVDAIKYSKKIGTNVTTNSVIGYNYDKNGNISSVSEMTGEILGYNYDVETRIIYTYDDLNRLIREDNFWANASYTYTYDAGGNITSKKTYDFTWYTLGTPTATSNYTYGDSNWKDKVTSVNAGDEEEIPFTYDEMGNMEFGSGFYFTWQKGSQLKTASFMGLVTSSFKYNSSGLRTEKTTSRYIGGTSKTTKYTYAGNLLMSQTDGTNTLDFAYDPNGQMLGVKYNGVNYYYMRSLQGDVTAIYNSNGDIVAKYVYDAWGNVVSVTDANGNAVSSDHIGNVNPIRYRGYYYDIETGMYYLQSRYYMPRFGRFISPDKLFVAGDPITGANMYAYCGNNPVNYSDPTGYWTAENQNQEFAKFLLVIFLGAPLVAIGYTQAMLEALGNTADEFIDNAARVLTESYDKIIEYSPHDSNKRPSNKNKHQKGDKRREMDDFGEKGDARRTPNPNKRRPNNEEYYFDPSFPLTTEEIVFWTFVAIFLKRDNNENTRNSYGYGYGVAY